MTPKLNGWNNNLTPSDGVGGRKPNHETLNSNPMTQLTKEEIEMIEREAKELYNRFNDAVSERYRIGYIHAATKYLLQLKSERERAWKLINGLSVIAEESKDMTTILYAKMLINQYNNNP